MKLVLVVALAAAACSKSTPVSHARVQRLVTGIADDWSSTTATLQLWERTDGPWHRVGESWPAVVGRNGLARISDKREGDGKSPAGTFHLVAAYGYADHDATALPYTQSTGLECVDDPASPHYNEIVNGSARDWSSSEQMRRDDVLYTHVVELDHNASHTPGRGSCIFLHVWGGADTTTSGCTAMPRDKLEALLRVVDRETRYVLLPRAE